MKYNVALDKQLEWIQKEEEYQRTAMPDHAEYFDFTLDMARRAEPYYWDEALIPLLREAGRQLTTLSFFSDDLPSPWGFLWLAHPIYVFLWKGDGIESAAYCQWIAWGITADGIEITYGLKDQEGISQWELGSRFSWTYGETRELKPQQDGGAHIDQILFAAFAFMRQRIVSSKHLSPDRATRRRASLVIPQEPLIRVVELRARQYQGHGSDPSEERDWQCRWLVRGHWRNQPYPKSGVVRPKWIAPYVKGPEDKPLKAVRARVFAVVR